MPKMGALPRDFNPNPRTSLYVRNIVMEYRPRSRRRSQLAYGTPERIVYRVIVNRGDNPRYLSVAHGRELPVGGRVGIYLERDDHFLAEMDLANRQDQAVLERVVKDWDVPKEEDDGWPQLLAKVDNLHNREVLFLRESVPVSDRDLVGLEEQIPLILSSYLTDGLRKDERLTYLSRVWLPEVAPGHVSPKEVAKYNPHGLEVTNTKTGKTTQGEKVGGTFRPVERATIAHLLGFSTARRDESYAGILNGLTGALFIDELSDVAPGDRAMMGLMNYLEKGEANVGRGYGNLVSGYAPVVFMGNPRSEGKAIEAAHLSEFLPRITTAYRALGSRLGVIFVDYKARPVEGKPLLAHDVANREAVVYSLRRKSAPAFSRLFRESKVVAWLERPHPETYLDRLKEMAESTASAAVAELLTGHRDSHRHVRGAALRLAFVDFWPSLPRNGWEIQDMAGLLAKAEDHYTKVRRINLESLARMAQRLGDLEADPDYLRQRLATLEPEYLRYVVGACVCLAADKTGTLVLGRGFKLEETEIYVNALKRGTGYAKLPAGQVLNRARGKKTKLNEELRRYGLQYVPSAGRVTVVDRQRAASLPSKLAPSLRSGGL